MNNRNSIRRSHGVVQGSTKHFSKDLILPYFLFFTSFI